MAGMSLDALVWYDVPGAAHPALGTVVSYGRDGVRVQAGGEKVDVPWRAVRQIAPALSDFRPVRPDAVPTLAGPVRSRARPDAEADAEAETAAKVAAGLAQHRALDAAQDTARVGRQPARPVPEPESEQQIVGRRTPARIPRPAASVGQRRLPGAGVLLRRGA